MWEINIGGYAIAWDGNLKMTILPSQLFVILIFNPYNSTNKATLIEDLVFPANMTDTNGESSCFNRTTTGRRPD